MTNSALATMLAGMRMVVILVTSTLALAACGGNSNPTSKAFGGLSDHDVTAVQTFSAKIRVVGADIASLQKRLTDEDLPGARTELDATSPDVDAADNAVIDIDSSQLRRTLQDYMTPIHRLVAAFDRWVSYFEDDSTPRDQALENKMLDDIQSASDQSQRADQALLNRILDNASPAQRDQIRSAYRAATSK